MRKKAGHFLFIQVALSPHNMEETKFFCWVNIVTLLLSIFKDFYLLPMYQIPEDFSLILNHVYHGI